MKRTSFLFLLLSPLVAFAKKKKNALVATTIISKGVEATETGPGTFSIIAPDLNGTLTYVSNPELPREVAILEVEFIVDSLANLSF